MIFSRRCLTHPDIPLISVNNTLINPSSSCIYIGLIIDEKLNWREHLIKKCTSTKRLLFIVNKCCRLTCGISRGNNSIIYKAIFLPKLLYGSTVWGGASRHTWCIKLLRAPSDLQRLRFPGPSKQTLDYRPSFLPTHLQQTKSSRNGCA